MWRKVMHTDTVINRECKCWGTVVIRKDSMWGGMGVLIATDDTTVRKL